MSMPEHRLPRIRPPRQNFAAAVSWRGLQSHSDVLVIFHFKGYEMPDDEYVFADRELLHESQRLHFLEAGLDPVTVACFETIGVAPGWRCLEVGAGAGSMARWLAQRVGPSGRSLRSTTTPGTCRACPAM
jgi:cyclopropane fatty-acyl-phospholipid synthase-like methyltransferase